MNLDQYATYTVIVTMLLASPGPSVLLSINNGLNYGKKLAAFGVLGNVIAFQLLLLISATSLGTIILAFEELLAVIKFFGASYLCYLGIKIYRSAVVQLSTGVSRPSIHSQPWLIFKQAFWVTSLNPKALIFVSALLPQFIYSKTPLIPQVTVLCIISALIHFTIYFSYAALADKAKHLINGNKNRQRFNKISGVTFLLFGIALVIPSFST